MGKKWTTDERNRPATWHDIVGAPDEWDKKNLEALISKFKKRKFTIEGREISGKLWIQLEVASSKHDHGLDQPFANKFALKSEETEMRVGTAIPNVLHSEIEEAYPTIFRDKKHFYWFVKNFPEFRVAEQM